MILILVILAGYTDLIFWNPNYLDPSKFGFPSLLGILIIILIAINVPWKKFGFRVKKIGSVELEQVMGGQAEGNAQQLGDLQAKIDELDDRLEHNSRMSVDGSIEDLVLSFLIKNERKAFSSTRIKTLIEEDESSDYSISKPLELKKIRESLRRLLNKEKVITKVSEKGNTLYKINK